MNRKDRRRTAAIARKAQPPKAAGPSRFPTTSGNRIRRPALLAAAAAGAIALAIPGAARAQVVVPPSNGPCVVDGTTATCTGNVSAGVDANGPAINTLNVNTLTQHIAPAAGIAGINFTNTGDITINGDTEPFAITTRGYSAAGIYAQSAGAGRVSVTHTGNISTIGKDAQGIWGSAYRDNATITQTGNISTIGNDAHGIRSYGDKVTITQTGNIRAAGSNASGVDARVSAGGVATVNLLGGSVQGGSGTGAGVNFSGPGGAENILNTSGALSLSALSGTAIDGGSGNTTVNNLGTLSTLGNRVSLGGGTNAFNNRAGATFDAGPTVDLGAPGNRFTNAGTLSPGGSFAVATTDINASFVQTAAGELLIDLDQGARSADRINVTGTGSLAGDVRVQSANLALGTQRHTIFSAAGGTTNDGLELIEIVTSPALNVSLLFPNATDVVLASVLDYTAPGTGLNPNQTRLGAQLNAAVAAGSGGLEPLLLALVNGPDTVPQYLDALDRLLPEVYLNTETAALFSSLTFTDDLFSCPLEGRGEAFIQEGQCLWVRPRGYDLEFHGTFENSAFDERTRGLSAGAQLRLAPGWHLNLGLGYERAATGTHTGADSDSDRYQGGLAIKYQRGPWLFAGALSGGIARFETERPIAFAGFPAARAVSAHDVGFIAGQLRGAYLVDFGAWYAKPLLDLNLTYIDRGALRERGAGTANLSIDGDSATYFSASPAIEIGAAYDIAPDSVIKPFIKAGITYFPDHSHGLTARFLSAPAGIGGFSATSAFDDLFADIEAGLAIIKTNGSSLSLGYQGRIGEDTDQHGLYAKVAWNF